MAPTAMIRRLATTVALLAGVGLFGGPAYAAAPRVAAAPPTLCTSADEEQGQVAGKADEAQAKQCHIKRAESAAARAAAYAKRAGNSPYTEQDAPRAADDASRAQRAAESAGGEYATSADAADASATAATAAIDATDIYARGAATAYSHGGTEAARLAAVAAAVAKRAADRATTAVDDAVEAGAREVTLNIKADEAEQKAIDAAVKTGAFNEG